MNKEEIENKIEEIFKRNTEVVKTKTKNGELWESFIFTEGFAEELSTLIQESNREAVEKFRSFCEGEVYEKRLSDEHYVLVSILIDAYLSSIGKEER